MNHPPVPAAQLTLLLTSPRVAPGLLTRSAWQVLEAAGTVWCSDVDDPVPAALGEAGLSATALTVASAAERGRVLVERATSEQVVWIGSPDGDPGLTDALAVELSRVAGHRDPPTVEVLVGSHDVPGARLIDLVAVMDRLRSPGGCPWDAEQTPTSLVPYLIEETYEAVEALESGDRAAIREELGDVLLQVVFHARMAQEDPQAPFDIDAVAEGIVAKLVRRHPHVFQPDDPEHADHLDHPDQPDHTAADVQQNWDRLKAAEKGRASVLDGIPAALPALARAEKVLGRLERVGFTVAAPQDELAAALLATVAHARGRGAHAETLLRTALRDLERRARDAGL